MGGLIFVAFSEYLNFNVIKHVFQILWPSYNIGHTYTISCICLSKYVLISIYFYIFRICYDDDVKVIALPYPTLSHDIVCISSLFCDVFGLFNDPFALSI